MKMHFVSNLVIRVAASALLMVGVAKVWSSFGAAQSLEQTDPVIGISFRKLLFAVGAVEILIALICFKTQYRLTLRAGLIAWLATCFVVYRIALWTIGWHHPCACMGGLAGMLHLSDKTADSIMKALLSYLFLGSYAVLILGFSTTNPNASEKADVK